MNSEFMKVALDLARVAADAGEVPVGAVIVKKGEIISVARNRREEKKNALAHAETEAISDACRRLKDWRLDGCEMYVTLEPCPMCMGAIVNSRISTLVFGAYDPKAGCIDSVLRLCDLPFDTKPEVYGGIYEEECAAVLSDFFKKIR